MPHRFFAFQHDRRGAGAPPRASRGRAPLAAFVALLLSACAPDSPMPAETSPAITLAVVNARVWTGDTARPWADAIAIAGDTIAAVGSSAELRKRLPASARVIDAKGGMVTPGFIDAHVHFLTGGFALASVQLRDAATPEAFVQRIAEHARTLPAGTWIQNGDWDHENWGGALPTRAWIDSVTPDHPVWINRLDGHMALANGAAMRAAGVTAQTAQVDGGEIVHDASGAPTGVFKDNAMSIVERVIPAPSAAELDRALEAAMTYVAARGVTAVHHMGFWDDLPVFQRAREANTLRTRIYAAVPLSTHERLAAHVQANGRGDAWFRTGLLKAFVDGSLGSHTAAMLEPFTDAPTDTGFFVTDPDTMLARMRAADAAGLQLAIHAIGDRAIRTQLDLFATVLAEHGPRDRRWRIEHAQHIHPDDVGRFAELGVIASMQPYHAIDDGRWAEKVIGPERARGTYAFRALLDAGAALAFGSDWFVAPPTPLEGIYAAVTRRTLDDANPGGWVPEQKITVDEALRAYTRGAAHAGFAEMTSGVLASGMLADFVLLDRDLTRIDPAAIREAQVRLTVVGGRIVHELP
jgi:predicted amidohydrolase YtcJ